MKPYPPSSAPVIQMRGMWRQPLTPHLVALGIVVALSTLAAGGGPIPLDTVEAFGNSPPAFASIRTPCRYGGNVTLGAEPTDGYVPMGIGLSPVAQTELSATTRMQQSDAALPDAPPELVAQLTLWLRSVDDEVAPLPFGTNCVDGASLPNTSTVSIFNLQRTSLVRLATRYAPPSAAALRPWVNQYRDMYLLYRCTDTAGTVASRVLLGRLPPNSILVLWRVSMPSLTVDIVAPRRNAIIVLQSEFQSGKGLNFRGGNYTDSLLVVSESTVISTNASADDLVPTQVTVAALSFYRTLLSGCTIFVTRVQCTAAMPPSQGALCPVLSASAVSFYNVTFAMTWTNATALKATTILVSETNITASAIGCTSAAEALSFVQCVFANPPTPAITAPPFPPSAGMPTALWRATQPPGFTFVVSRCNVRADSSQSTAIRADASVATVSTSTLQIPRTIFYVYSSSLSAEARDRADTLSLRKVTATVMDVAIVAFRSTLAANSSMNASATIASVLSDSSIAGTGFYIGLLHCDVVAMQHAAGLSFILSVHNSSVAATDARLVTHASSVAAYSKAGFAYVACAVLGSQISGDRFVLSVSDCNVSVRTDTGAAVLSSLIRGVSVTGANTSWLVTSSAIAMVSQSKQGSTGTFVASLVDGSLGGALSRMLLARCHVTSTSTAARYESIGSVVSYLDDGVAPIIGWRCPLGGCYIFVAGCDIQVTSTASQTVLVSSIAYGIVQGAHMGVQLLRTALVISYEPLSTDAQCLVGSVGHSRTNGHAQMFSAVSVSLWSSFVDIRIPQTIPNTVDWVVMVLATSKSEWNSPGSYLLGSRCNFRIVTAGDFGHIVVGSARIEVAVVADDWFIAAVASVIDITAALSTIAMVASAYANVILTGANNAIVAHLCSIRLVSQRNAIARDPFAMIGTLAESCYLGPLRILSPPSTSGIILHRSKVTVTWYRIFLLVTFNPLDIIGDYPNVAMILRHADVTVDTNLDRFYAFATIPGSSPLTTSANYVFVVQVNVRVGVGTTAKLDPTPGQLTRYCDVYIEPACIPAPCPPDACLQSVKDRTLETVSSVLDALTLVYDADWIVRSNTTGLPFDDSAPALPSPSSPEQWYDGTSSSPLPPPLCAVITYAIMNDTRKGTARWNAGNVSQAPILSTAAFSVVAMDKGGILRWPLSNTASTSYSLSGAVTASPSETPSLSATPSHTKTAFVTMTEEATTTHRETRTQALTDTIMWIPEERRLRSASSSAPTHSASLTEMQTRSAARLTRPTWAPSAISSGTLSPSETSQFTRTSMTRATKPRDAATVRSRAPTPSHTVRRRKSRTPVVARSDGAAIASNASDGPPAVSATVREATSGAVAVVSVAAMVSSPGTVALAQRLSSNMLLLQCPRRVETMEPPPRWFHPVPFKVGPPLAWLNHTSPASGGDVDDGTAFVLLQHRSAVITGLFILLPALVALGGVLSAAHFRWLGSARTRATARCIASVPLWLTFILRWPGALVVVWTVLCGPLLESGMSAMYASQFHAFDVCAFSFVATVHGIVVAFVAWSSTGARLHARQVAVDPDPKAPLPTWMQYWLTGGFVWVAGNEKEPDSDDAHRPPSHRRHRALYDDYRQPCSWFLAFELVTSAAAAVIGSVKSPVRDHCTAATWILAALQVVGVLVVVAARPYVGPVGNAHAVLVATLCAVASGLLAAEEVAAGSLLNVIALVLTGLRFLLDALLKVLEHSTVMKARILEAIRQSEGTTRTIKPILAFNQAGPVAEAFAPLPLEMEVLLPEPSLLPPGADSLSVTIRENERIAAPARASAPGPAMSSALREELERLLNPSNDIEEAFSVTTMRQSAFVPLGDHRIQLEDIFDDADDDSDAARRRRML